MDTLTVKDLVQHIRSVSNLTVYDANKLAGIVLSFIEDSLRKGKSVKLRGLGTFGIKTFKAKKIKHPQTGKEIILPKRKAICYRPAKSLKESVKKIK
jgi:DNA-binding protein HU-beta